MPLTSTDEDATDEVAADEAVATDEAADDVEDAADGDERGRRGRRRAALPTDEDGDLLEAVDPVKAFKDDLAGKFGDWYVVHSYAGYENRVKANLETRIVSLNMEEYIFEIEVPMEEVTEIKSGQRKLVRRVRMPGYVLVRMDLTDESWGAVRHTPGVTGFVGNAHQPVPLTLDEVYGMIKPADLESLRRRRRRGWPGRHRRRPARGRGRRLRGRRVGHRHGRPVRDPPRDDLRDQPRHPEAQGARLHLRPGDPGRALLQPGLQDLT